jgi:hypothetical protein
MVVRFTTTYASSAYHHSGPPREILQGGTRLLRASGTEISLEPIELEYNAQLGVYVDFIYPIELEYNGRLRTKLLPQENISYFQF